MHLSSILIVYNSKRYLWSARPFVAETYHNKTTQLESMSFIAWIYISVGALYHDYYEFKKIE